MVNSGPVAVSRLLGGRLRFLTATLTAAGAALLVQVTGPPRQAVAAILAAAAAAVVLLAAQAHDRWHTVRALRARLDQQATETERLVRRAVPAVLAGADPATLQQLPETAVDPALAAAHRSLLSELAHFARRQLDREDFGRQLMATVAGRLQTRLRRVAAELHQLELGRRGDTALHHHLLRLEHGVRMSGRAALKLAVLGGGLPLCPSPRPVSLAEVLRASSAPLTEYPRVKRLAVPDVAVAGPAVEPLCVVLTELLDNATRYSPPGTVVTVSAARLGGDVEITVRDRGTGLTGEQLRHVEALLRGEEPVAGVAWRGGTVRLGLRVVGLLADRYDLRVRLLPADPQGTGTGDPDGVTARVLVPACWVTTRRRDRWGAPDTSSAPWPRPPDPAGLTAAGRWASVGAEGAPWPGVADAGAQGTEDYPHPQTPVAGTAGPGGAGPPGTFDDGRPGD